MSQAKVGEKQKHILKTGREHWKESLGFFT